MSKENADLVRTWMDAFLRHDREALARSFEFIDPEIEWDASRAAEAFQGVDDLSGVYRGHEGVRSFWRTWMSAWGDLQFEMDVRDAGDDVVVLIRNQRQWGRHSGIQTEIPPYAWRYTFRGNKVVRACWHPDHESALEAAGLSENQLDTGSDLDAGR